MKGINELNVELINLKSGILFLVKGVGTQIIITSNFLTFE